MANIHFFLACTLWRPDPAGSAHPPLLALRPCNADVALHLPPPPRNLSAQPSLCVLGGRGGGCMRYRPSSALRNHLHSTATVPPLRPFCPLVPPHPPFLPVWHARDLPRTPTDRHRQTAVWSSGCPATRRCLPAGIDARGCIHPTSQPAAISSRVAIAQIPRSPGPSEK